MGKETLCKTQRKVSEERAKYGKDKSRVITSQIYFGWILHLILTVSKCMNKYLMSKILTEY